MSFATGTPAGDQLAAVLKFPVVTMVLVVAKHTWRHDRTKMRTKIAERAGRWNLFLLVVTWPRAVPTADNESSVTSKTLFN